MDILKSHLLTFGRKNFDSLLPPSHPNTSVNHASAAEHNTSKSFLNNSSTHSSSGHSMNSASFTMSFLSVHSDSEAKMALRAMGIIGDNQNNPESTQSQIVLKESVYVCGNMHRLLPSQFSKTHIAVPAALLYIPVHDLPTYSLAIGNIRISLLSSFEIVPNLVDIQSSEEFQNQYTFTLRNKEGKYISIRVPSLRQVKQLHSHLTDSLVHLILAQSIQFTKEGTISAKKIENSLHKISFYAFSDKPAGVNGNISRKNLDSVLRLRRILSLKRDLNEIVNRLTSDLTAFSKEEVDEFFDRADVEAVSSRINLISLDIV
jgi:hypothetical protein